MKAKFVSPVNIVPSGRVKVKRTLLPRIGSPGPTTKTREHDSAKFGGGPKKYPGRVSMIKILPVG